MCLLPNSRHLLGIWGEEVLRLHRGDDRLQGQLLLVRVLGRPCPGLHGGELKYS